MWESIITEEAKRFNLGDKAIFKTENPLTATIYIVTGNDGEKITISDKGNTKIVSPLELNTYEEYNIELKKAQENFRKTLGL
jgi:hypothetical protein